MARPWQALAGRKIFTGQGSDIPEVKKLHDKRNPARVKTSRVFYCKNYEQTKIETEMKNKTRKDQGDPQQILAGRLTGRASDFDSDLCWFESSPAS